MNLHLKYILFGASILLFASLLHSCSDNYQDGSYAEDNNYAIATAKQSYTVSADEQTIVLAINDASHDNSINWSLTTLPSWIKTSTTWGRGTANVSLEIMQNTSFTQNREAVIFIEAHGGSNWSTKIPVTITQNVQVRPIHNNHEYVDLGLPSGLKWATCNIGASVPEQIGNYYAWGETTTKSSYTESNYKYHSSAGYTKYTHWEENCSGNPDGKHYLELSDDAARQNWGGSWRMPAVYEVAELRENCTITDTYINGVPVQKVVGPNGNYIILPFNYNSGNTNTPIRSNIWSSQIVSNRSDWNNMRAYSFTESGEYEDSYYCYYRYNGLPVRPVFK